METGRPRTWLCTLKAMLLLLVMPLLFAHRPISVHHRASRLERMPQLFGKRDSLLTYHSFPPDSILKPRLDVLPSQWDLPSEPNRYSVQTAMLPFLGKRRFNDVKNPLVFPVPSVMYEKLQEYIARKRSPAFYDDAEELPRNSQTRPHLFLLSEQPNRPMHRFANYLLFRGEK